MADTILCGIQASSLSELLLQRGEILATGVLMLINQFVN